MKSSLTFRAGFQALKSIERNGLDPRRVKVIAGAAGGPKWLVLGQMDKYLFGTWLRDRKEPLHLIGSSIGAWRFSAASQKDPVRGIENFEKAYFGQTYSKAPTVEEISKECERVLGEFLKDEDIDYILNHPFVRLNVLAVKCKNLFKSEDKRALLTGMVMATGLNALHPKMLHTFFERAVFLNAHERLSFLERTRHRYCLSSTNFRHALIASGSIPGVMLAVKELQEAPKAALRDGGILDYHLDLPYREEVKDDDLVLFPHYQSRIIPNWFDKYFKWRKHKKEHFENVLLIAPSKEFISKLPLGKIPDRNDFKVFKDRDDERLKYWSTVVKECERLKDELQSIFEKGALPHFTPL